MLREDYILSWIRRYVQWIAELLGFVRAQNHELALRRIDLMLRTLLDTGPDSVTSLSDGEILARLTLGDPPQLVQEKCVVLAVVLEQLGIIFLANGRQDVARDCFLKALHLVVGLRLRGASPQLAEHAPAIERLADRLRPLTASPRTWASLVLLFEREGRFAKAEDALFTLLDAAPDNAEAIEIGIAFYKRLSALSDTTLQAGDLPRPEVDSGLAVMQERLRKLQQQPPAGH